MPEPGVPYDPTDPSGERSHVSWVRAKMLQPDLSGGVSLAAREGVFAQSFKCSSCTLHFVLFSWSATQHNPTTIAGCPECGSRAHFMHRTTLLSTSTQFRTDPERQPEIYDVWPYRTPTVP